MLSIIKTFIYQYDKKEKDSEKLKVKFEHAAVKHTHVLNDN